VPKLTTFTVEISQFDWDGADDAFLDRLTSELTDRVESTIQSVADGYDVELQTCE
jgi:hypothetical protein